MKCYALWGFFKTYSRMLMNVSNETYSKMMQKKKKHNLGNSYEALQNIKNFIVNQITIFVLPKPIY